MTNQTQNRKLQVQVASTSCSRGFTLVEMITVLTIIILVLAIAIPVWKALLGGTNVAQAQNQISATLANARADAIYNRQTIGVCFFVDPKTQRTAMAEVQVQTLYQGGTLTPLFIPNVPNTVNDGQVNALELVNYPDPSSTTNPPNYIFYRDIVLLPQGVGVALTNNTYTYNQYNVWNLSGTFPPVDRYRRVGAIMFAPDGTLTAIPFGVPDQEQFTSLSPPNVENLLCERMGMYYPSSGPYYDLGSLAASPNAQQPLYLTSSVGLVIFDHDAYIAQHASLTVGNTGTQIGDDSQFNDLDMNYTLTGSGTNPTINSPQAQDKFIEEHWIDQNGIALMVNPSDGSLLRAK
ncbi:MAG TPA: prepilin-type N-terminal cleavage/methylation domain-containing protein [Tepidisphaeraceae bacterium]|jgi:prepilin-type N-terminal cleavage/methylation domain-containing protein|nr:prepilin-type N-terminal cleavage/methylation domain-containing protein [Tepidisphaeraceae bacterium]